MFCTDVCKCEGLRRNILHDSKVIIDEVEEDNEDDNAVDNA